MLRKLLLFIVLLTAGYVNSQSLYWVGGSGNWSDGAHWSYTRGGHPAGVAPSLNSDVFFDGEEVNPLNIQFQNLTRVKSLTISRKNVSFQKGSSTSILEVSSDFLVLNNFQSDIDFNFVNPNVQIEHTINSGSARLNSDFNIFSGKWKIKNIVTALNNKVSIENSKVIFQGAYIETGELNLNNNLELQIKSSFFQVNRTLSTGNNANEVVTKSKLNGSFITTNVSGQNTLIAKFNLNVSSPASPCILTPTVVKPSCVPGCDGKIIFTIPSPTSSCYSAIVPPVTPPFNVLINNAASCSAIPGINGLSAGTYTIDSVCNCGSDYTLLLFDQNQFIESQASQVTTPNISAIITGSNAIKCFAACTGSLGINFIGGVAPYNFTVSAPSVAPTVTISNGPLSLTNLCAGTLSISAVDSKSCTATFTTLINQPPQLLANGSSTNITCFGFCTGAVNIAPTGGTPSYTVNWSTPFTQTLSPGGSSSQSSLCVGAITGTVTDSKSCTAVYSATITQPPAITLTVTKTNLICGSLCDGTATVTATGGSGAGYTYTWSSGGSTGPVNNALCAGPYTVTVADNFNCVKSITFTLTAPPTLTATPTQTNLTCNSACIGAINLNPSGGTGTYTYSWSPPAVSTASTATSLCAGPYTYTVTDAVNCTYSNTVTIIQPPAITLTVNHTDVTCFGACNGTAVGNISGGTGAYTYSWSPGNPVGQGTNTVTNLCPGTYTLRATDANGCFRTGTVTVTQPIVISPNTSSVSPSCNGSCNGSINSAPTGGTAPYTFTLQPAVGAPIVGTPPFTGLCGGTYTLSIKDALDCIITRTISLSQPNPITLSLSATPLNCFNQCNSNISTVINGGSPTYTVNWSGGGTGMSISNQCAGVHTATVMDSKGCQATASINIVPPPDMTITVTAVNPNCNTQCTGIASATISGGTPNYTVNWSNGPIGNVNPNLCNGTYTATVTDFKGCVKTQTIAIITPPALTLTATNGTVSCSGSCDGTVSVTASGGTSGYFYSWNSSPVQTNSVAVGLCVGNYIASVSDSKGCVASTTASVIQPPVLTTSVSNVQPSCNICIGSATADGIGGTAPYTYSWSPGGQSVQTATNLCVGVHTVEVTDSKGCKSTQTVQIVQTINIAITANSNLLSCNGICSGVATANASGGTGPGTYSYSWTPQVPMQNTQTATALCAGSHTVLVIDANGCSNTNVVSFSNPPAITLTVNQTNINCSGLCNGTAGAIASGGTGSFSYLWSNGATTSSINNLCAGVYTVTATDANNCSQTQVVTITQSSALTASFTNTNPSGCNTTDGSISFVPGGGSGSYTFTWSPGPSTNPLVNLGDGTYVLNIRDSNGCTLSFTTTLSDPLGPTVTATSNSIVCFGSCTGSASLSISSGTPTFSVNWAAPLSSTNTVVSGLCAGNYQATITDANGCATNQTISIAQPTQISSSGAVSNLACNAVCSGSIDITTSGGVGAYSYSWSPSGSNVEDPIGLCAGNYSVNITDVNNCSVTNTFVITQPASLNLSFNKKDVLCNGGCTGAVGAVVSGGTSPYSYTWTPSGAFMGSNLDTIINLCSGIYTVSVRDLNGCLITGTINIGEPTVLTSSILATNVKCNGQCNGIAVIQPSGGTIPYSFSYNTNPSTSTQTVSNLCVGVYNGVVTDANNCISSNSFTITQPLPIVSTLTVSNPKCNSVCDGSITTSVSGGNGGFQYNWFPSGGTSANPSGLCAGNYTVTITDDSLCTHQALASLVEPSALLSNPTFTNPICSAGCNGIVTSSPTGGTAPYTYLWATPSNTNQTVSGLCAGDYTLFVSDLNSCRDTQIVTLTTISTITVNPAMSPATCGVSNGSIDAVATGGTPNYTYNWLNPVIIGLGQQTNSVVVGIPAGMYTVVVNDAASCSSTVTILLSNSNGPSGATITSTNVACKNQCNGAISITNPVGGTAPYTINWINPVSTNTLLTNLCAGFYSAQIEDSNNCLLFITDTIYEPQLIDDNENIVSALCAGSCVGSIALNPTGGNGGFTYSWTPSATTGTITNLCPGVYTSTITDALGCTLVTNYTMPSLISITSNTVITDNSCFNDCNGTVSAANVAGGIPPYSYNWTDPLGQSTSSATGLCNGNYTVTIRDFNGCLIQMPATVNSPSAITFTPTITQPGCGLCDGVAVVNPVGGTPNYSYVWSANNQVGNTANNLCAGLYIVQITDGNGCVSNSNVVINSSSTFTGETITKADVSCSGICDGSVTVTAIGGVAPVTYHWVHNNSSSQSLAGLCSGTYFCNMTDANGCIRTASVIIGATSTLTLTPFVTQSSCSSSTGSITVNVTGGTGPLTYAWLPSGNTSSLSNLAPGSYTLTVSDGSCSQTQVFSIGTVNGPLIGFTKKDISCGGVSDGNIVLTLSAGTPTYSTLWSNGATTTSITALNSGNYSVTVTDAAGCKAVQNFSLGTLSPIIFSAPGVNDVLCFNNCDGSITSIPSGGSLPYTYSWTPVTSSAPTNNNLCPGNYSITVTDANGCLASETYSLVNPAPLTFTALVTDASCSSVPDAAIDLTIVGGTPQYTFSWTPNGSTAEDQANILYGNYTVSITDVNGCRKDSSIQVNANIVVIAVAGNDTSFCVNGPVTLNGSNSMGGITYQWLELPLQTVVSNTTTALIPTIAGTSTYVLVATNGSCSDQDSIIINAYPLPVVDAGPFVSIPALATAAIGGSPTGPIGSTFNWSPATALDNITTANPTSSTTITTVYTVTVVDANGCSNSDTVTVFIYPQVIIPNGFSPNGDGKNDVWQIDLIYQFPDCEVEVYNRWGEQLFYSKGYAIPFNGQYKGKDLPVGTYYYIINLNHPSHPEALTSPLTIFR
jgi:gliding motility-associated-like protein